MNLEQQILIKKAQKSLQAAKQLNSTGYKEKPKKSGFMAKPCYE